MTQSVEGGLGLLTGWGPGLGPRFSSGKSLPFSSLRTSFRVCLLPPPCGVCVCVCLFAYAWAPLSPEVLGFQEEVSVDPSRRIWKPEKARPAEAVVRCVLQPETALLQPRSLPVPMPQIPLLKKKKKKTILTSQDARTGQGLRDVWRASVVGWSGVGSTQALCSWAVSPCAA